MFRIPSFFIRSCLDFRSCKNTPITKTTSVQFPPGPCVSLCACFASPKDPNFGQRCCHETNSADATTENRVLISFLDFIHPGVVGCRMLYLKNHLTKDGCCHLPKKKHIMKTQGPVMFPENPGRKFRKKKHNIASKVTILADGHSIASDSCSKASVLLN